MYGSQAATFYQERQREALGLIGGYQELRVHLDQNLSVIAQKLMDARFQLGQAYLPALDQASLDRAKSLTGFLGFERRDPLKAMAHERTVLEHTIERIRVEERYQKREELASTHGTLQTKLIEIREMLAPWQAECSTFEDQQGFLELVHVGYDTPRFDGSWWQPMYWKHWSWGDRICKELQMDDFGDDVLPKYRRAAEQRGFWQEEETKYTTQVEAIHALVQEHDQAVARIPNLESLYLRQCQQYLGEYVEQADTGLLEGWLTEQGGDRSVLIALRTMAGLKAKQGLLTELRNQGLDSLLENLRNRAGKFARKTQKYLRSKHYHRSIADSELDHKFAAKVGKYQDRQTKLRKMVDRLVAYNRYERFSLENDPLLWWYEFTGKQPPRELSNTRRWYERNQGWKINHDLDDDAVGNAAAQAVAAATVSRELDEVGYLS